MRASELQFNIARFKECRTNMWGINYLFMFKSLKLDTEKKSLCGRKKKKNLIRIFLHEVRLSLAL